MPTDRSTNALCLLENPRTPAYGASEAPCVAPSQSLSPSTPRYPQKAQASSSRRRYEDRRLHTASYTIFYYYYYYIHVVAEARALSLSRSCASISILSLLFFACDLLAKSIKSMPPSINRRQWSHRHCPKRPRRRRIRIIRNSSIAHDAGGGDGMEKESTRSSRKMRMVAMAVRSGPTRTGTRAARTTTTDSSRRRPPHHHLPLVPQPRSHPAAAAPRPRRSGRCRSTLPTSVRPANPRPR